MNLMRRREAWDPLDVMSEWQEDLNRLFGRSLLKKNGWQKSFEPEIDVTEEKEYFRVRADLPGIKKEDLDVKVDGRMLTVRGERKEEKETKEKNYFASERLHGAFCRVIELPMDVKADQIKAAYKDGVLEINLPKTEGAKSKRITVEVK